MQIYIVTILLAAVQVYGANVVKQKVVYSAKGTSDVVGNGFGCAHSKSGVYETYYGIRYSADMVCSISHTRGSFQPAWLR